MKYVVTVTRLLVGVLFILSGFIKANDPLGFSYKLDEYFTVFSLPQLIPLSLSLSILTCILEIILGMAVLIGYRMKTVTWTLLIMILFFTWLTGYSAITGKVTDCGCFGDALKLEPVQSFYKDVVLFILIILIFFNLKSIKPLTGALAGHGIMLTATLLSTGFTLWCYFHLPVIDFRPYAVGKNIPAQMVIPEGAPADEWDVIYTLQKKGTNEVKIVNSRDYISQKIWEDSTWVLLTDKTENKLIQKGYHPPVHDFTITSPDGTDLTDSILHYNGYVFLIIAYDLHKTSLSHTEEMNRLYRHCHENKIPFLGLTASSDKAIDDFKHKTQSLYDFYITDETALKTMIRSNPGIMLLKKGTVMAMWHHNDVPEYEDVKNKYLK